MNVNIPTNIGGLVRLTTDSARTASSASNSLSGSAESPSTAALLPTDFASVASTPVDTQASAPEQAAADKAQQARQQSQKVNDYLTQAGTQLKFTVSEETGRIIISVIDT